MGMDECMTEIKDQDAQYLKVRFDVWLTPRARPLMYFVNPFLDMDCK